MKSRLSVSLSVLLLSLLVTLVPVRAEGIFSDPDQRLEASGCAYLLSVMVRERSGVVLSELEALMLLMMHGDSKNIIDTQGFTFYDVKRAVGVLGLRASAFRSDDLLLDLAHRSRQWRDGPYLVLMDNAEGRGRFMLYYGEDGDYVQLLDPLLHRVRIPREAFNQSFRPYVLIIEGMSSDFSEL